MLAVAGEHRRELLIANIVALLAVACGVPIPLLMPLLVDEVLLDKPGALVGFIHSLFPQGWEGPALAIMFTLALTIALRAAMILLNVWQLSKFTIVAKDITYRIRRALFALYHRY